MVSGGPSWCISIMQGGGGGTSDPKELGGVLIKYRPCSIIVAGGGSS